MQPAKISVFAAALAAFCLPTQAAEVTVYGTVDTGLEVYDNGDRTNVRLSSGLRIGSHFGFREDL